MVAENTPEYENHHKIDESTQTSKQIASKIRSKSVQCKLNTGISVILSRIRPICKDAETSPNLKDTLVLQRFNSKSSSCSSISEKVREQSEEDKYISESDSSFVFIGWKSNGERKGRT